MEAVLTLGARTARQTDAMTPVHRLSLFWRPAAETVDPRDRGA